MLSPRVAAEYKARIPKSPSFLPVLLAQMALPSEAVGYICGLLRVAPLTYALALAAAELPYALGTVLLGAAFFRREYAVLLSVALTGLLAVGWVGWQQRKARPPRSGSGR